MNQVYMQSLEALGTTVELRLVVQDRSIAEALFPVLWTEVQLFEQQLSRFLPDSEVTRLNRTAGAKVHVSALCRDVLQTAQEYSRRTNGLFNPFVLPELVRAGYRASMTTPQEELPEYATRDVVEGTELTVGTNWARIPPNSAIDLGGIGKGYLADYLGRLVPNTVAGYSFSLGGDLLLSGTTEEDGPWRVLIQSATNREKDIATYTGKEETFSVATSGIVREKDGMHQTHQMHPSRGHHYTSSSTLCTVAAPTATSADVFASSILLGGVKLAQHLAATSDIYAALVQPNNGGPIVFGTGFSLLQ